jgi:hypothetical protein
MMSARSRRQNAVWRWREVELTHTQAAVGARSASPASGNSVFNTQALQARIEGARPNLISYVVSYVRG